MRKRCGNCLFVWRAIFPPRASLLCAGRLAQWAYPEASSSFGKPT